MGIMGEGNPFLHPALADQQAVLPQDFGKLQLGLAGGNGPHALEFKVTGQTDQTE